MAYEERKSWKRVELTLNERGIRMLESHASDAVQGSAVGPTRRSAERRIEPAVTPYPSLYLAVTLSRTARYGESCLLQATKRGSLRHSD